jgi:hypothetical protein
MADSVKSVQPSLGCYKHQPAAQGMYSQLTGAMTTVSAAATSGAGVGRTALPDLWAAGAPGGGRVRRYWWEPSHQTMVPRPNVRAKSKERAKPAQSVGDWNRHEIREPHSSHLASHCPHFDEYGGAV